MSKCIMISGHRDISSTEFSEQYAHQLIDLVLKGYSFVVGDCNGVDYASQKLLETCGATDVTIYHMKDEPNFYVEGFTTIGGFKSDVDRDFAMTLTSDEDLAWVRKGKERSGTAQNIYRRGVKAQGVTDIKEIMTLEAGMFLYE